LAALLQWYSGTGSVLWLFPSQYESHIAGTFANRGQYAALIELLLPVSLLACFERRSPLLPAICCGLMISSVIATGSRAGTVLVCAEALVVFAAVSFSRHFACLRDWEKIFRETAPSRSRLCSFTGLLGHAPKQAVFFYRPLRARLGNALQTTEPRPQGSGRSLTVAAILVLCAAAGGWGYLSKRLTIEEPFELRGKLLASTVEMVRSKPLTGFGLGTWPAVYPAFALVDPPGVYMNHAHNDWAEWTAEGGLPMLALAGLLAVAAALSLRTSLWGLGVAAVLVHSLVDFPMQKPALACAVFFVLGVCSNRGVTACPESRSSERQRP
jgi:hypothetical protein